MRHQDYYLALVIYCTLTRASTTSGIRTPLHNQAVGGIQNSPHLFGLAHDVVYDEAQAVSTRETYAAQLGLRLIHEEDHDHIQPADWKQQ